MDRRDQVQEKIDSERESGDVGDDYDGDDDLPDDVEIVEGCCKEVG